VEIGFFAVLHNWGQNLHFHPHLHCIVPGGGLSADHDRWIPSRPGFFLPVKVLSRLFRRLFLEALEKAYAAGQLQFFGALEPLRDPPAFARYLTPLKNTDWVVYAKPPFGGPQQVLQYLGRYTHRVAISNRRLLALEDGQVSFQWKDYRDQQQQKVMTVSAEEFIQRFLQHALPPRFQRIRYYGFWPTAIAPQSWSYAAGCWPLPAPTYFRAPPIAGIFWRRSPPAILACARNAESESSSGYNCSLATVRFPCAWTPHEARPRKLCNAPGSVLQAGHTPAVFTPILYCACAP
jgi:hypothetical protein